MTVLAVVSLVAAASGRRAERSMVPSQKAAVDAWAELVTDPEPRGPGTAAIVEIDGRRFVVDVFGGRGRRLRALLAGDRVRLAGRIGPLPVERARRLAYRHVVGRLDIEVIGDRAPQRPAARAANRLRALLADGAVSMPPVERSLFAGLVIGDDRDEPAELVDAFRRSGLSHLTAVSGQNIGFLLIAAAPLLRRLRPVARWAATLGLIGWFALLTRFEPSIMRAGAMAVLSATTFWRGWRASPLRLLSLAVAALTIYDPLLVTSVGWWLSVGATAGIAVLAPRLADRIAGPRWIAEPIAVSLAAQVGVLPAELLVFGRVPLVGLPANLLAGPPAGFVMIWGIPAALASALVPAIGAVLQWPCLIATRWVIAVARLASAADPDWPPWVSGLVQVLLIIFVCYLPRRRIERQ